MASMTILIIIPAALIHCDVIRQSVFQYTGLRPNSVEMIFYAFCAILYGIGCLFGMTYQESSVYICIYLWPILLGASSLPILCNGIRRAIKRRSLISFLHLFLSGAYVSIFGVLCVIMWRHYNQPTIAEQFNKCMDDLIVSAEKFGISYSALNLLFFIVLFAIVVLMNYGIYRFQNKCIMPRSQIRMTSNPFSPSENENQSVHI